MRCRVLCADPPWKFGDGLGKRGAGAKYQTLNIHQIRGFELPRLERNSWLFLWRVSSQVEEAYSVMRAWGFEPKSEIVWEKLTKTGKRWVGMGHYTRGSHETCILAARGRVRPKVRNILSRFAASVPVDVNGKYIHSAKPEEFYDIVERLCGRGPYVELFARRQRPGWLCLGDQATVERVS